MLQLPVHSYPDEIFHCALYGGSNWSDLSNTATYINDLLPLLEA
jgi:hypothetical protein